MTVSTVSCSTPAVWHDFKDLDKTLQTGNAAEVAQLLDENRKYLLNPLGGAPRNPSKKTQIDRGESEPVETDEGPKNLTKAIIAEVAIISGLYDLDEHKTLELLWAAEHRLAQFPGLTRGLIGVLLYWDGRYSLVHALNTLCQTSFGSRENMNAGIDHVSVQFLNMFWDDNIFGSMIKAYSTLSIEGELDKLAKQRGLGDAEHKRSIRNLITNVKVLLAESIYCLAFHERINAQNMTDLVDFVSKMEPNGQGSLSQSDTTVLFTVIHMIEVDAKEDMDSLSELPLLSDSSRISLLHSKIFLSPSFKSKSVLSFIQLAWSMTLSGLTQLPLNTNLATLTECDDQCLDKALNGGAFTFLRLLVDSDAIRAENELVIRQIHKLITDIIVLMPLKLKELRKASAPSLWIELSELITTFYRKFEAFGLHNEFWSAFHGLKPTHRCLALQDFIRIDMISPELYVPTVKMLEALGAGETAAAACFRLLRQTAGNLSWERIFESLRHYCDHLRIEVGVSQANWSEAGISPEETSALVSVVKLAASVAKHDSNSRQVILEQQSWRVPLYLMQLLRCGIAPSLKAACIDCLAALIGNEGAAASLWVSLDADNVLQGIVQEVERIESQEERYPLTISFCNLIRKLCEYPLPVNLGTGSRPPGVAPYVEFLTSNVLLRLDAFSFKVKSEKWELAQLSLDAIVLLLASYTPSMDDFNKGSAVHPGFGLYRKLLSDSPVFRKLLETIIQTGEHLESYPSEFDEGLLRCGQRSLNILSTALRGSKQFMNVCRDAGAGIILTPIHQLLASINPKTQKADIIRNISKLVGFAAEQPHLAQSALEILLDLSHKISASDMLNLTVCGPSSHREHLMKSFWQCLELSDEGGGKCRITILKLILQYIDCASVSLSHYLLGYPLQAPLSSASLQDPGVLNSPKTVLHALLAILTSQEQSGESEELLELGYEVIYRLSANTETSAPVLRYLRSTYDFVFDQLQSFKSNAEISIEQLRSVGWLLKLSALELHGTSQAKQRSITARLVQLILQRGDVRRTGQYTDNTITIGELSALGADHTTSLTIMTIFRVLDLTDSFLEPPDCDLLDICVVEQVAQQATEDGAVNLLKVHDMLQSELASQIDPSGQIPPKLEQEVADVLRWLQKTNQNRKLSTAKIHFLEGWRQLLEVCLAGPMDIVPTGVRVSILQEILQELLTCVNKPEATTQLTSMLSTVALSIMTHLRISLKQQQEPSAAHETSSATFLDGTMSEMTATPIIPSSTLLPSIGEGLIQWCVSAKSQRVRSHLYASLLNYFQLQPDFQIQTDMHASRLFNETMAAGTAMASSASKILNLYGTSIMSITCQDAVDGHSVTRTLAFALLDSIMRRDGDKKWLAFMREKGYLKRIIASIGLEDAALVDSLSGSSSRLASVYVHESRMSLMSTLARHRLGARSLVETGLIQQLADVKFIDTRPVSNMGDGPAHESKIHRYRMLLFPVLRLIMCLQSTLGVSNDNIQQHCFHFVLRHLDALTTAIFANSDLGSDGETLEEIHLITSVLCIVAGHDFSISGIENLPDGSLTQFAVQQNKIRRLLFAMQTTYILTESWISRTERSAYLAAQRTSANITMMITQIMLNSCYKNNGKDNIVLSPVLAVETLSTNDDLPLGVIIRLLKEGMADFVETIQIYSSKQRNLDNVAALPSVILDELAGVSDMSQDNGDRLSLAQKQQKARESLQKQLENSEKIMQIQHMQLESAVFIIWRHIDFYLSSSPIKTKSILFGDSDVGIHSQRLSSKQLTELRLGLSSALNETTIKRLTDAEVQYFQAKGADESLSRDFIHPVAYRLQKIIELNRT